MNYVIVLLLIALTSCATITEVNTSNDKKVNDLLGQKIVIIGTPVNRKLGAILITEDSTSIWIHGKENWPKRYYSGKDNRIKLRVTGIIIEKYDLPVYIHKEGDLPKAGIPVPEGTNLKEASHRYLIKNVRWKILSEQDDSLTRSKDNKTQKVI